MSAKKRDVVFQQWSGVIRRETRDVASLEQIRMRALADHNVRDDPTLQGMIQAEVERRRGELDQERQAEQSRAASVRVQAEKPPKPEEPPPATPPDQIRAAFNRLARTLSESLERRDETGTRDVLAKMRAIQKQSPEVIPAPAIVNYEQRVEKLRIHVKELTDEVAAQAQQAVSAASDGNEEQLARSMRRLTAIHAAHPHLLDESGLEGVRRNVAHAAEARRQHEGIAKRLLERERAITAEIKALATAVHDFHRVACSVPASSEEFRKAEAMYLQTIEKVRTYDTEWFSGVVLDLADLLAEWAVPPLEAEGQIDRFLDSISKGLDHIRTEMREIESERDSD